MVPADGRQMNVAKIAFMKDYKSIGLTLFGTPPL